MNVSVQRSTPAAGSMTYGMNRSPASWSKNDRSAPDALECVLRS